ncbi:MAG TPA: hypothetical protein PK228_02390 [Saprospiraceae bacterium]|nr:hypothetical protein [Saprospiraceae bacterium]
MHWKFDELFSIRVLHEKFLLDPPNDTATYAPEFTLVPSEQTRLRFRGLSWVTKQQANGIMVFAEKVIDEKGQAFIKSNPLKNEAFTFLLKLNNPGLLFETQPFVSGGGANPDLPAFTGRGRVFYFDNLHPVTQPDGSLLMTAGNFADIAELASRAPLPFSFASADTTKVEVTPLTSGNATAQTFELDTKTKSVVLDLPENAYRFVQLPANRSETIFMTNEMLNSDVFGVVRIFNSTALPTLGQYRPYKALFAKA